MKTYSLTEGEVPHAGTSIAQNRDSGNRRSLAEGTGRTPQHVSSLWREATPTRGNGASEHSHDLRTRAGGATAFSLSGVLASLVSSQSAVHRAQRSNDEPAIARSSHAGRMLLALSRGQRHAQAAEWSPNQCARDPEASQPGRQAASRAAARGGRADMLPCRPGGFSNREGRAGHVGGIGWRLGV